MMFKSIRPLVRIAAELRRIANVMEYFAVADARANNRIFVVGRPRWGQKDESELLHTDDGLIARIRAEEQATMISRGYRELDERDTLDETPEESQ